MPKKPYNWTEEMNQVLKDRYKTDGPAKLSKELEVPYWTLMSQVRRLNIPLTRKLPTEFEWTEERLQVLRDRYVSESYYKLSEEWGLLPERVSKKANEIGLQTNAGHVRWGDERAETNTSLDIHYFDEWSPNMAYILGFLFADGCINKGETQVSIGLVRTDVSVLEFMKKETQAKTEIRFTDAKPNHKGGIDKPQCHLYLCSKVMVKRLMEIGMMPRKTFRDDPFPEVPNEMLPHFIRGYFDGDGCISWDKRESTHSLGFVGSPKLIKGIRDRLVQHAGMRHKKVSTICGKTADWSTVDWGDSRDHRKFYNYVYPEGFEFCLDRKKNKIEFRLEKVLRIKHMWLNEEIELVKECYADLGPDKLSEIIDRTPEAIRFKANSMGVYRYNVSN